MTLIRMTLTAKLLIATLLVVFVLLQTALWDRHHGLPGLWELRGLNLAGEIEINELQARSQVLEQGISDMKSGLGAIEKEAREELGMVKQEETFFRVIERAPQEPAP